MKKKNILFEKLLQEYNEMSQKEQSYFKNFKDFKEYKKSQLVSVKKTSANRIDFTKYYYW